VIGLVAARLQRRRRARIPPNSNTRTTTMISTHNHVDMAASLVGAGAGQADTTAAHSGKQLPGVQATSRAGIDGRAAGSRGAPCTLRSARRSGLARQPIMRRRRVGRALRATPSQPSPTVSTSTTEEEDPAGGNRPHATTARPTGEGYGEAEKSLPCLGGGTIQAWCAETQWQTPRRRRRTDGARLRRNPNLRRGRLHRPALPVQPRSMLRDPPRVGRAGGDSAAATLPLSCRGPMLSSTRSCLRASASKATVVGDCPGWMLGIVRPAREHWVSTALAADPW
jgi:hypothetical protein